MRYLHQFVHMMVSFRIASDDRIPSTILSLLCEAKNQRQEAALPGEKFIDSTKDVYFSNLFTQVEARKFQLVGVSLEQNYDRKGPPYMRLRAQFARHDFVRELDDNFKKFRSALRFELQSVCDDAGWSIVAYDNPYFSNGNRLEGAHSLSINANAPEWLINPDGTPVLVWDRPKNQEGASKINRKAANLLQISAEGAIEIIKA